MNLYGLIGLFNGTVVLSIGSYLFASRRQSPLYKSFAVMSFSIGFWSIFYALWQVQTNKDLALFCSRLLMLFCYPIPASFFWFVCNLTGIQLKKWQSSFLWIFPSCLSLFAFSPWAVKSVESRLSFPFWPVPGIVAHIYFLSLFLLVIAAFVILFRSYRRAEGLQRWQYKWVFLTFIPIWVGGSTNIPLWYSFPVYPAPNIFVGVGFLVLFYAIIRSRLLDIKAITDLVQEAKLSALGIMATSINHEVRNPLFVIRGMAETLLEKSHADPAKVKEIAERTVVQADRALEIIHNFSAYAKRQSKTFDKQSLDLKAVIENIVPLVQSELTLDNIRLQIEVPPKTMVYADRRSLEEIFLNLIVNACQAIKETGKPGEIKIAATVIASRGDGEAISNLRSPRPKNGLAMTGATTPSPSLSLGERDGVRGAGQVIITIQDNGPGIAKEQLSRIFEPFYTTKDSGTGLGLYVVKQLVEKNGGKVDVQSTLECGTIFSVTLPAEIKAKQ